MSHSASKASAPTDPAGLTHSEAIALAFPKMGNFVEDGIVGAIVKNLHELGVPVTPGLSDGLLKQPKEMRQLAVLLNLYEGCTPGGEEVGVPDGLAAEWCGALRRSLMECPGYTCNGGGGDGDNEYRKVALPRIEALLRTFSPEQRAMEFAERVMAEALCLWSSHFAAEAALNLLRGKDLDSVMTQAEIDRLFRLLKITPKDKLCELHDRFEDVFSNIKPEHVVLPLMPEAYQRDLKNVERVLLANASDENMDCGLLDHQTSLFENRDFCDELARRQPQILNQSPEYWTAQLWYAFIWVKRESLDCRDYGKNGQTMNDIDDAFMKKAVLKYAENQRSEGNICRDSLSKARSAMPSDDEEESDEEESGPEEASDDDEEESRKRSRSPGRPAPAPSPKRAPECVFF